MERRSEPRFPATQPLTVTRLGAESEAEFSHSGVLIDNSGNGMRILVPGKYPREAAVRVNLGDGLFHGEVRPCADAQTGFVIGVEIHHSLFNLSRIERLRRAFLEVDRNREPDRKPTC